MCIHQLNIPLVEQILADDDPLVVENTFLCYRTGYVTLLREFHADLQSKILETLRKGDVTKEEGLMAILSRIAMEIAALDAKNSDGQERVRGNSGFEPFQMTPTILM